MSVADEILYTGSMTAPSRRFWGRGMGGVRWRRSLALATCVCALTHACNALYGVTPGSPLPEDGGAPGSDGAGVCVADTAAAADFNVEPFVDSSGSCHAMAADDQALYWAADT